MYLVELQLLSQKKEMIQSKMHHLNAFPRFVFTNRWYFNTQVIWNELLDYLVGLFNLCTQIPRPGFKFFIEMQPQKELCQTFMKQMQTLTQAKQQQINCDVSNRKMESIIA